MNRSFKFRVWDSQNKRMLNPDGNRLEAWINDYSVAELSQEFLNESHVDDLINPIIQQYTGLKDKNNKEIYEGDILSNNEYATPVTVSYIEQFGAFFPFLHKFNDEYYDEGLEKDKIEVIGNIYENPDLKSFEYEYLED